MRGETQTVIDKTCDAAIELLVRVFCSKRFATPLPQIAPPTDARAILAAVRAGLIVTPSSTILRPDDSVSRQEFATSRARAFQLTKTSSTTPSDAQEIASYATSSVRAVLAAGYMADYPDNTFKPTQAITRSEAALALFGALKDRP
jgi:hypothetical protein